MPNQLLSQSPSLEQTDRATQIARLQKAYSADQQVKYLHLEAEIDVLLQQLQILKK